MELAARNIFRLLIQMPPRHGKTELVARYFIAWYLLHHPEHRVIYVTNTSRLAGRYGRFVRALIDEFGPEYGVYVSASKGAATDFELSDAEGRPYGGGLLSFGFKTRITGRGADLLVMDDLLSADDAQSEVFRQAAWDYWAADASTRLQPNSGIVVEIQTRHHEDDLAGRLEAATEAGAESWVRVRFPAVAEDDDVLGRKVGEALWPEMFPWVKDEAWAVANGSKANPDDPNVLSKIKIRSGPYWWSAEYQQRPTPLEGSFFKKTDWRYFTVAEGGTLRDGPYILHRIGEDNILVGKGMGTLVITVDLATSEKTVADYTVWVIGRILPGGNILVLDVVRDHLSGPEVSDSTIALKLQWEPDLIGVEKKGFQLAIIQGIWRQNVPVQELDVKGDKVGRALPSSARVSAHSVYLHQSAPFIGEFVDECLMFPRGTHDDQVDAFAYLGLEAEKLGLGDAWVQAAADEAEKIQKANRGLL